MKADNVTYRALLRALVKTLQSPQTPPAAPGSFRIPDTSLAHPSHSPPSPASTWEPCASYDGGQMQRIERYEVCNVTPKGPVSAAQAAAFVIATPHPRPPPHLSLAARLTGRLSGRTATLGMIALCSLIAIACGLVGLCWP